MAKLFTKVLKFYILILFLTFCYLGFITEHLHQRYTTNNNRNIIELESWTKNASRNISDYINLKVANLPKKFCNLKTTLMVIVFSKPTNFYSRTAIRENWGKHTFRRNASVFFLMGHSNRSEIKKLNHLEQVKYKDIIIENFVDTYMNLSLKALVMLKLFAAQKNCNYLIKTDDDVFLNVPLLVKELENTTNSGILSGRIVKNEKRQKDYSHKWYAPSYMYWQDEYPSFLAGPAYLMAQSVAAKLLQTATTIPIFHLEDVYITGICAKKAQIPLVDDQRFTDYQIPFKKCSLLKLYSAHSFRPPEMYKAQLLFNKLQTFC